MRNKPLIFKLITLFFFTAPVLITALLIKKSSLPFFENYKLLELTISKEYILQFWLIPLIAGSTMLIIRQWGYYLFVASQATMAFGPLFFQNYYPPSITTEATALIYLIQTFSLFFLSYMLFGPQKDVFFNSSMRWWQQAKRFHVPLHMNLFTNNGNTVKDSTILNISRTGVFFTSHEKLNYEIGDIIQAKVSFMDFELRIPIKLIRFGKCGHSSGWGAKFIFKGLRNRLVIVQFIRRIKDREKFIANIEEPISYAKAS